MWKKNNYAKELFRLSEWQDLQQKPNTKLQDLFKNKKAKTRNLSVLFKTKQNKLTTLNGMFDELRCGDNVQKSSIRDIAD